MATLLSTAFNQRKKFIYCPILKTPTALPPPKNLSQTDHHVSQQNGKIISSKENAELKLVQEWRSMKTNNAGIKPPGPNVDDDRELLQVQPFVEEPVSFNFGRDYGTQIFVDLRKELMVDWLPRRGRGIKVSEWMKYSDDDIYMLSTEADMINSFFRDNLF